MWIYLAGAGALFQATEMAIKKKALQTRGLNNTIAFLAFTFAGVLMGLLFFLINGSFWPDTDLSIRFWHGMFWYASLNVVATWFMYKALDISDLSYLMPFMTLTSLSIIIPPIFVLGEVPTVASLIGIATVAIGALLMDYRSNARIAVESEAEREKKRNNRKGKFYFLVTALCFTFTPTATKVAIEESSPLFASYLAYLLIGLSFIILILVFKEQGRAREILSGEKAKNFLLAVGLAGVSIAIANLSINFALDDAPVAYVMAIKRIMPLFAFVIGYFYFHERSEIPKKLVATALMILGAILITLFN